jgi:putative isomerase
MMSNVNASFYLNLLRNQIDITHAPFSNRASRLFILKDPQESRLSIHVAERLVTRQPDLYAYSTRSPFVQDFCFVDRRGKPLNFEVTTYPHILKFKTQLGEFDLVFQDDQTISFGFPPMVTAGVRFKVTPQIWRKTEQGGALISIRDLIYTTDGEVISNQITPDEAGVSYVELTINAQAESTLALSICDDVNEAPEMLPFSEAKSQAEKHWTSWFARVPDVVEKYRSSYAYAWWIMANNLIAPKGEVAYEAMTPSKNYYVGLWLWDCAMHALAYRYVDPELARNQLRAIMDHQLSDGMFPDAVYDEDVVSKMDYPVKANVTKPPILAWMALKLHEAHPDKDFLKEIYIPLVRWNSWWFSMNDDDVDGLAQYNHPYSSGLDNNPLWDFGMPVESPDLNTYLCVQMGSLAIMAEELGLLPEAQMWRRRASEIVQRMIEDFWDDEAGVFRALHNEEPIPVITPFNLYPLWTGQVPFAIKNRLIEHIKDPNMFGGEYVLPSVARNDPRFEPENYWRGPVWVNINYFFIEALSQVGEYELARTIRTKTLNMIMQQRDFYEYYNAEDGKPAPKAANTFGWSASVFIDLAIKASAESDTESGASPQKT